MFNYGEVVFLKISYKVEKRGLALQYALNIFTGECTHLLLQAFTGSIPELSKGKYVSSGAFDELHKKALRGLLLLLLHLMRAPHAP